MFKCVEDLRSPCGRSQSNCMCDTKTSMIRRILCTKTGSGSASSGADPARSDQECLDLTAKLSTSSSVCASNSSSWATSSLTSAVTKDVISIPLTNNKLSSLCNSVWLCCVWIRSGKNRVPVSAGWSLQYRCRVATKGKNWFENSTRMKKHSDAFVLLEVGILPDVLHHVGDELHSMCEFQGSDNDILCPGYWLGHAWSFLILKNSKLIVTLFIIMIFLCLDCIKQLHLWLVSVKDTEQLSLLRSTDSSVLRSYICLCPYLSCSCLCLYCCWSCRVHFVQVSSNLASNVQFCHSSCRCWNLCYLSDYLSDFGRLLVSFP